MDLSQIHKRLLKRELVTLPLVSYEPASLREWSTGWQIEYRVLNPDTGLLEKKRLRFEKIRKRLGDHKARKYARIYCDAINDKLESGWNPYQEVKKVKSFHKLTDALDSFIKEKVIDLKNGIFRHDSARTYKSQVNIFTHWLHQTGRQDMSVISFTKELALEYLDYVYTDKQLSARSYNNYLSFMRTLWNWLIEKNYCSDNFWSKIKPKPKTEKTRTIIPSSYNKLIIEYFRRENPIMEIICGLIYNSFMRPAEICRTQISDLRISDNAIYLPPNKTKNGHARWCLLPPHLLKMILELGIDKYPSDYYLFSRQLRPGKTQLCSRKLDKYWDKMRTSIGLPMDMKLYSYRDTGITDLKKAGHSNLFISSITGHLNSDEIETYTHAPNPHALQYIMEQSLKL